MNQKLTLNELVSLLYARSCFSRGDKPDPRRDLDKECGYDKDPTTETFARVFEKNGLATRIVSLMPNECFAATPEIYETERPRDTAFEKGIKSLLKSPRSNFLTQCHLADIACGINTFGGLLLGFDDNKPLDTIVDGLTETGEPTPARPKDRRIMYMEPYYEGEYGVKVRSVQSDPSNPRFNQPQLYELAFNHVDENGNVTKGVTTPKLVHWSRFHHMVNDGSFSRTYSRSRLRNVYDQLCDIRKILGSSAEMFYKGGFPGYVVQTDPRWLAAGVNVEIDDSETDEEMRKLMDGLQRWVKADGVEVKSLAPQVADPTAHVMVQLNFIAQAVGVPLRILMGSEEAKLASGQDAKAFNKRIVHRQVNHVTPFVLRPLIDRFIATGVLAAPKVYDPKVGSWDYNVFWPDVSMPDLTEMSQIADRLAAAMMKYRMSSAHELIQPSDFWRLIMGRTVEEVEVIMENIKKPPEVEFTDLTAAGAGAADSGSKGNPPSDPQPASRA